jgi:ELWxxDGT repeat protein
MSPNSIKQFFIKTALLSIFLLVVHQLSFAQTGLKLLKDINQTGTPVGSDPSPVVRMKNGSIYFAATTTLRGQELWKSDGTESGTTIVADIFPGADHSLIKGLTAVNDKLFFLAKNNTSEGLWVSDGTRSGTKFLKDFIPSYINEFFNLNDKLLFFYGYQLWISDGTEEGTVRITDAPYQSYLGGKIVGGVLYFSGDDGVSGIELWRTDGTSIGTYRVADIDPGFSPSTPKNFIEANGALYFIAYKTGSANKVWRLDNNSLQEISTSSATPIDLTSVNGTIYFVDTDYDLWKISGNTQTLVKDFPSVGLYPDNLTEAGGKLFFSAEAEGAGYELWVSDGTTNGTHLVKDLVPGSNSGIPYMMPDLPNFTAFKNELVFIAFDNKDSFELWKSDGTEGGTKIIREVVQTANELYPLMYGISIVDDILYWTVDDGIHGTELWRTDGTSAGTLMVKNIASESGDANAMLHSDENTNGLILDNELFFLANDGVHGMELWKTNGTPDGTKRFSAITTQVESTYWSYFLSLAQQINNYIIFPIETSFSGNQVWRTDGTEAGTIQLTDFIETDYLEAKNCTSCNDKMFFLVEDNSTGVNLWTTNGTKDGTFKINDSNKVDAKICVNNILYYILDGYNDPKLWRTDGTAEGTLQLTDGDKQSIGLLGGLNNKLYFLVEQQEVWETDGTVGGTHLVHTFDEAAPTYGFKEIDNVIFIFHGDSLWKISGDEPILFLHNFPDGHPTFQQALRKINDEMYFMIEYWLDGPDKKELWKTDGTPEGTTLIKNVGTFNVNDGYASILWAEFDNKIFFEGKDPDHGRAIWSSDGTEAGTHFVKDIQGASLVDIDNVVEYKSAVYFTSNDNLGNRQIWMLNKEDCVTQQLTYFTQVIWHFVVLNDKLIISASTEEYGAGELFYYDLNSIPQSCVTAVEKNDHLQLMVYPNPADKAIYVRYDAPVEFKIVDMMGRTIMKGTTSNADSPVMIEHLNAGTYVFIAFTSHGQIAKKIVVK